MSPADFIIRKAEIGDVPFMQNLINDFAKEELMLPLSLVEIYEQLRDFIVAYHPKTSELAGACALHVCWEDLAEIRSLAVSREYQRRGLARLLVETLNREAYSLGVRRVFVLTYAPEFFRALQFLPIDKATLPHKIWADCIKCHKFPHCDEEAMELKLSPGGEHAR